MVSDASGNRRGSAPNWKARSDASQGAGHELTRQVGHPCGLKVALAFCAALTSYGIANGPEAWAQAVAGRSDVFVNNQLLQSLGPGGVPYGGLPYGGVPFGAGPGATPFAAFPQGAPGGYVSPFGGGGFGSYISRPGTLLFPPAQRPRSEVVPSARSALAGVTPRLTPPGGSAPLAGGGGGGTQSRLMVPLPPQQAAVPTSPPAPPPSAAPTRPVTTQPSVTPQQPPPPPSIAAAPADPPAPSVAPPPPAVQPPPAPAAPTPAPQAEAPALPPPPPPAEADSTAQASSPPPPAVPVEPVTTQTAALPSATAPAVDDLSISFQGESAELSSAAQSSLLALAQRLNSDSGQRVQLLAFASGSDGSASKARRLSLSRALAVRAFLIEQGVESTRMDVRALGNRSTEGPPDRVDIELAGS